MSITTDIQQLYVAYFNRPADPTGLAYWEQTANAAIGGGQTQEAVIAAIAASFAKQPEYTALYTGLTSDAIIGQVYLNMFGRTPDPAGLSYWSLLLAQGRIALNEIVRVVAAAAQGTDAVAYESKVAGATAFTASIDTTSDVRGYDGQAAGSLAKNWLAGITDAASLAKALAPETLSQSVLVVTGQVTTPAPTPTPTPTPPTPTPAPTPAPEPTPDPSQTYTLSPSADTLSAAYGNDTFSSPAGSIGLTKGDSVNGGDGYDTLTLKDSIAISLPNGTATVTNIESASVTSTTSSVVVDASAWTGLTSLAVNAAGVTKGVTATVTAPSTSTVAVNFNPVGNNVGAGTIFVSGGTTVNISQTQANAVNTTNTNSSVTVSGAAATTAVTVASSAAATASASKAGVNANSVFIGDVNYGSTTKAGTITSATVSNFTSLFFQDNALTTLSVTGGAGNIIIDNSGLDSPTNKTLGLTINGETGGTLDDADIYTALNVTTTGADSRLANLTFGALNTLTIAGTKTLTLTSTAGATALKTVTVSGSAGVKADLSFTSTLTSVNTAASTGTSTISIDASKAILTAGAGVENVTLANTVPANAIALGDGNDSLNLGGMSAVPTVTLDGGNGTDNLTMTASFAAASSGSGAFAGKVIGFEELTLNSATNQTVDLAMLGNFSKVSTSGGNGLTLSNLPTGGTLTLTGAGTAYTLGNAAFKAGGGATVNLVLKDGSGSGVSFASTGITAANVETIAITTADTQATPSGTFYDSVTVLGNSAQTITVAGNAGLILTATDTALTSVDASGITLGGFTYTSGALAGAASIKGSANGTNTINTAAAVGAVTYTGGAGSDVVTLSNNVANAVSLGDGNDRLNLSATAPTGALDGGNGTDTLAMTAAAAATASLNGKVSGFEVLALTGATNQTIDVSNLGGINTVSLSGGNGFTLSNFASGGTLELTGAGTAYTASNAAFTAGGSDTVNLTLKDGSGSGVSFATTGVTLAFVENVALTTVDTQATPSGSFSDSITLLGNASHSITVSGNAGLALTATSTALTSVDASGITLGGFSYTSGALASAAAIKGSATGTNTVNASAATGGAVTYTGGTGSDNVTLANGNNNVIDVGNGTNTVVVSSGNNTITGGTGVDTITVGGGANTIAVGTGAAADVLNFTAPGANISTFSTVNDAHALVSFNFADKGVETFTTTAATSGTNTLQALADQVVVTGGNASTNGAFGWFQFGGDTYLVESRHDGGATAHFVDGTDFIVKLVGSYDLSTMTGVGTASLTLQ